MSIEAALTGSGETAMEDCDLCQAVGEDLMQTFPNYPWFVGVEHGSVIIDLCIDKPLGLSRYAYRLNISTVIGPGGQKRVRQAGGELLERFGLRRGPAHPDTDLIAAEHGLDISGARNKSKH
jgi:hypothetical protein